MDTLEALKCHSQVVCGSSNEEKQNKNNKETMTWRKSNTPGHDTAGHYECTSLSYGIQKRFCMGAHLKQEISNERQDFSREFHKIFISSRFDKRNVFSKTPAYSARTGSKMKNPENLIAHLNEPSQVVCSPDHPEGPRLIWE